MKGRILFVYGNEPDPITVRKIDALARYGVGEVHLCYWQRSQSTISYPFECNLPRDRIHPVELPDPRGNLIWRTFITFRFYLRLKKIVQKLSPKIVHATNLDMLIASVLAVRDLHEVKMVYDLEDTNQLMMNKVFKLIQRRLFRKTALILVTSRRFESHFLRALGLIEPAQKVLYVPNAPPAALFPKPKVREENGLLIGYLGTFRGVVSLATLIAAVRQLNSEGEQVSIRFAGSGEELALVQQAARMHAFVSYLGPYDYKSQIGTLYDGIDVVYAIYDLDHNKKMALACRMSEAILCQLPILVPKNTYMGEIIEHIGNGLVVEPADVQALIAAIRCLVEEKRKGVNRGDLGASVRHEHIFESYEKVFCETYQQLLESPSLTECRGSPAAVGF